MLTLFKNHNMMMPVDFGDNNPYTIKAKELEPVSPESATSDTSSQWDWNKLFHPMQQVMNGMNGINGIKMSENIPISTEKKDDFKYPSPFKKTAENNGLFKYSSPFKKDISSPSTPGSTLNADAAEFNPNAIPFQFTAPSPPKPVLNPNAVSFKFFDLKMSKRESMDSGESGESKQDKENKPCLVMADKKGIAAKKRISRRITKKKKKNVKKLDYNNDDTILAMHGFKKIKKMEDSLQGTIYVGETIRGHDIVKQLKIPRTKKRRVVIKKTLKTLHKKRISIQDGMNIVVDENVVKEAIILHHLTVDNSPAGSSICKLLSFFESSDAYYIVSEYGGNQTLKQFVDVAHEYIKKGKLDPIHWKKICKYIGWQIAATLYWMHTDMNCAHLDLTLENIIINNGNFSINDKDGTVTIDRNLTCKIIDFGLAEIFKIDPKDKNEKIKEYFQYDVDDEILGAFHINTKYGIASSHQSPETFNEFVYDARKCDIWGLGVVLFYMSFGVYPFKKQMPTDSGFWAIKHNKIDLFLDMNHLSHLSNNKLLALINGCLCYQETERFDIAKVVTNLHFKTYFKKYAQKIKDQSQAQKEKNIENKHKMDKKIPYYEPQK